MNLGDIGLLSDPNLSDINRFDQFHSLEEMSTTMAFVDALFSWTYTGTDDDDRLLYYVTEKVASGFLLAKRPRGMISQALREKKKHAPTLFGYSHSK